MQRHEASYTRELTLQFLYQCEITKVFYFTESAFSLFLKSQETQPERLDALRTLCSGVLDTLDVLDKSLSEISTKWSVERMLVMDRLVLRLAAYELIYTKAPVKVILNEAIELAKKFGTKNSAKFVNGVLDKLAQTKRA